VLPNIIRISIHKTQDYGSTKDTYGTIAQGDFKRGTQKEES
jgi:hypothetical protein